MFNLKSSVNKERYGCKQTLRCCLVIEKRLIWEYFYFMITWSIGKNFLTCTIYIIGPRSGKTGLNDKHFDVRVSTFSINDIFYDLNAKRTMSLTRLIA